MSAQINAAEYRLNVKHSHASFLLNISAPLGKVHKEGFVVGFIVKLRINCSYIGIGIRCHNGHPGLNVD